MSPFLTTQWQNPSSGYLASKHLRKRIEEARAQVASLIGARPEEVFFTSGGTEANNSALFSLAHLLPTASIATSQIEHSSILKPLEFLCSTGREVHFLPVDQEGITSLNSLSTLQPAILSLMWTNNEVGTHQPLSEAIQWAQNHGVPIHSDAVQAAGKVPISVKDFPVDLLSLSGHKFHGPKGIGALYVRQGFRFKPFLYGGGQEGNHRSGTENVAGIIGMGKAAELAMEALSESPEQHALQEVRDHFEKRIIEEVSGVTRNGAAKNRLPGLSHLSFSGCEAAGLVILLDEYGVQCSAGSACMTGKQEASHVQLAMGFSREKATSSLRFSFCAHHTLSDADTAVEAVKKAVEKLRSVQSIGIGSVTVYTA